MTRDEFLTQLRERIAELPQEERQDVMNYYIEYFDDAGPENEQSVINQLGSPEAVACEAMGGLLRSRSAEPEHAGEKEPGANPQPNQEPPRSGEQWGPAPPKGRGIWAVILAICAAPVALPLAIAGVAVVVALAIAAVALVGSLLLVAVALVVCGILSIVCSFFALNMGPGTVLYFLGSGMLVTCLGLLFSLGLWKLGVVLFRGIGNIGSNWINRRRQPQ